NNNNNNNNDNNNNNNNNNNGNELGEEKDEKSRPPQVDYHIETRRKQGQRDTYRASQAYCYEGSRVKYSTTDRVGEAEYEERFDVDYDINKKVGEGAYASVYLATTPSRKHRVAIKKLELLNTKQQPNPEKDINPYINPSGRPFMYQEGIPLTVIREITALKNLEHENIVKMYDILLEKKDRRSKLSVVLEYAPYDLHTVMDALKEYYKSKDSNYQRAPPPPPEPYWFSCKNIKSIIHDILQGLDFMKTRHYYHRDLKPANILLTSEGRAKIADFGLARAKYSDECALTNGQHVITRCDVEQFQTLVEVCGWPGPVKSTSEDNN
ncbi:hypothetical protein RFI_02504, partial [Reticulomyxa filosa]